MVPGLFERPAVLWGTLASLLLALSLIPAVYLHRHVENASRGLVAGSYVATLVSLVGVPVIPLQYLSLVGGFHGLASKLTVAAGYLLGLLVATTVYAAVLRWRLGPALPERTRLVAVATVPATNLLFLASSPVIFVFAVGVGRTV